jgi:hypothetical protein
MEIKVCSKCEEEKNICEFYKRKDTKDGYRSDCKKCFNERSLIYKEKNQKKIKELRQKYFQKNKKLLLEKKQNWRKDNPEEYKKQNKNYWEKTKDTQSQKKKVWIENNREKYNSYWVNRKNNDHEFKLLMDMRSRLCGYLKKHNITKKNKTFDIVGCSPEFLKEHLENKFTDGMSWDNRSKWHIDHIVPLSSAKNEEELYKLCHYTNLQPLWAEDNLKKSNKIVEQFNLIK